MAGARNGTGSRRGGRVTIHELAAHAAVSPATVSLVLRKSPLVRPGTRARVQAAIEALGYVYDRNAARMRARLSHTVGVVVVDLTSPFYAELLAGIDEVLDGAGFLAFISNTDEDPGRQARVIDRFRENAVDGVILCPAIGAAASWIGRVTTAGLPLVQALRWIEGSATDYVGTDNRLGTRLAVEHLIEGGHTRIVFVGGAADTTVARDRRAGYRDAMLARGLEPSEHLCRSVKTEAADAFATALAERPRPTAAVCFNDGVAFGVLLAVRDAGLRPGHDVAVVGFDDIADAAIATPSLSSVAISPAAIGQAAAEMLLARIAEPGRPPQHRVLTPRLMIRQSSALAQPDPKTRTGDEARWLEPRV